MSNDLSGLNLAELYDLLEPIAEPATIPMTPQTAGWAVLGVLLALVIATTVAFGLRHRRANAYRRAGLAALNSAGTDAAAIASVLRRTAIAAYPRSMVAGLHGQEWLEWLDRTSGAAGFGGSPAGRALLKGPYQSCAPDPDLPVLAREWITRHRRGQPGK